MAIPWILFRPPQDVDVPKFPRIDILGRSRPRPGAGFRRSRPKKIKSSRPRHGSRTHRRPRLNYFWNSGPRPRLGRPVLRSSDPATETFVYNVRLSAVIESLFAFSSTRRWFLSVLVKFSNRWIFFIFSTKPLSRQDEKLEVRCRGGILKLSEQVICPQFSPS